MLIGVAAGISQRIVPRFGIRAVAIGGVTVGAAGLALMARAGVHSTYAGTLLPSFVLLAVGLGFAFVPATLIGVSSVQHRGRGPRLGAVQHRAADRRRARPRDPRDDRRDATPSNALAALGHHPSAAQVAAATVSGYRLAFIVAAGLMLIAIVVLVAVPAASAISSTSRSRMEPGARRGLVGADRRRAPPRADAQRNRAAAARGGGARLRRGRHRRRAPARSRGAPASRRGRCSATSPTKCDLVAAVLIDRHGGSCGR